MRRPFLPPLAAAVLLVAAGCDGDGTAPPLAASLSFVADTLELDTARTARLTLRNTGALAAGPVSFEAGSATDAAGDALPGVSLVFSPAALAGLEAGESATVDAEVLLPAVPPPGAYTVEVRARAGDLVARSTLHLRVAEPPTPAAGVRFTLAPDSARQGDVVDLAVEATDGAGGIIEDPAVTWAVLPADAGLVTPDGRFVGYQPGDVRVVATVAQGADTALLRVSARGLSGSLVVLGRGPVDTRYTSDLWVHGAHAYTGTWGARTLGDTSRAGNTLYAWSIANPASPVRTDSVVVDATTVNDVKVSADGTLAVLTHEGSQLNGITLLDLADPAHPRVLSRFTEGLDHGVHNVWIEGGYVYAVSQGLKVIDVATPTAPRLVASVPVGDPFLHDVYVRDGLAFLSAWNEGLVILDVGNGIAAGAPTAP
ncbi:MAG TPA: hypothetical protein VMK65_07155, partial [Longimicrobiales bacterium]|nr:hypothetical protein [Longimicrobiales bacterium]